MIKPFCVQSSLFFYHKILLLNDFITVCACSKIEHNHWQVHNKKIVWNVYFMIYLRKCESPCDQIQFNDRLEFEFLVYGWTVITAQRSYRDLPKLIFFLIVPSSSLKLGSLTLFLTGGPQRPPPQRNWRLLKNAFIYRFESS